MFARNRNGRGLGRSWLACAAVVVAAAALPAQAQSQWKPERPVEFIAINAPGGGGDRILRIMIKVMQEGKHVETPVNVINRPGGGGAVAYAYLNQHAGSGNHLLMANRSLISNNIVGRGPHFSEITPIATLFNEYIAVTVKPDSPLRSGRDLVERLRKDPGSLAIGVAGSLGNPAHQTIVAPLKAAGVDPRKLRIVIFPSGGAASTALLGGHIDVLPITAAFAASQLRNGQLRLITVSSEKRLPDVLAEVPTWPEQGYDVSVRSWRGMVGPKGVTAPQLAYWEATLQRLSESEDWKKELDRNFWINAYMRGDEMRKMLERDYAESREFLTGLGLAK